MSRPLSRFSPKALARSVAKLAFGVTVFATTVGAYTYISGTARLRTGLPDSRESDGQCAVWLVGSSSIHRWTSAAQDLRGWQVHNRGIEAARLLELQQRLDITTSGGHPAAIILYAGENDLSDGTPASNVLKSLERLAGTLERQSPGSKLFVVSMKPSPTRWANRPAQLAVDAGLRSFAAVHASIDFIDAGKLLLVDGRPGAFYQNDGIHLSTQGYARWGDEIERHLDRSFTGLARRCGVTAGEN